MGWITDRQVSALEWRWHNLRYAVIQWIAGRDIVMINCVLNKDGTVVQGPRNGERLFLKNCTLYAEGSPVDVEAVLQGE